MTEKDSKKQKTKKRPLLRLFVLVMVVYMGAGYLTTAFRRVEVSEAVEPRLSLPSPPRTLISGVFSVHTGRSHDAHGTRDQVAAAAAKADLDFVIIGDHPPDPRRPDWEIWEPEFREGVFIDGGVELRAPRAGKVLAMGVDSTFKRWEGGLGSFMGFLNGQQAAGIVVHGRGPRDSERWVHRRVQGVQGWEVLDISEFARARLRSFWGPYHLITTLLGYPFGLADEALLHLMREGFDTPTIAAYDSLRVRGPLTATAGLNIHPKLSLGPILFPSYGPFFRTLVSHMAVEVPLPSEPTWSQEVIGEAIKRGEVFISLGDHEAARAFRMRAVVTEGVGAHMGADVGARSGIRLRAGFEEDPGRKVVYRIVGSGREREWVLGPELEWEPTRPALYRVEVYTYAARIGSVFFRLKPWIFANPVGLLGVGYAPR